MAWRVARSLNVLLDQINAAAPGRNKASDGSLGDQAHSSRASDHNPDSRGIVHARDFTHDPARGCDIDAIFAGIVASGDSRVKYLIRSRRIAQWQSGRLVWTPYSGTNPHTTHGHISVTTAGEDDTSAWAIDSQEDGMGITSRSESRDGQKVIWIGLHTTEGNGTARQLRDADWWKGSSHAIADNRELLTPAEGCVPYNRASWTLRRGNKISVNIEQIGWAKWPRDHWLGTQMPMLRHTARWVGDMSKMFEVPLEYIGIQGVRDRRSGVIQHNDYSKATGDGSHWDCGPGYPIDVVMDMARGADKEDELSVQFETDMRKWCVATDKRFSDLWGRFGVRADGKDRLTDLWTQEQATQAEVAKLLAEVKALREKH